MSTVTTTKNEGTNGLDSKQSEGFKKMRENLTSGGIAYQHIGNKSANLTKLNAKSGAKWTEAELKEFESQMTLLLLSGQIAKKQGQRSIPDVWISGGAKPWNTCLGSFQDKPRAIIDGEGTIILTVNRLYKMFAEEQLIMLMMQAGIKREDFNDENLKNFPVLKNPIYIGRAWETKASWGSYLCFLGVEHLLLEKTDLYVKNESLMSALVCAYFYSIVVIKKKSKDKLTTEEQKTLQNNIIKKKVGLLERKLTTTQSAKTMKEYLQHYQSIVGNMPSVRNSSTGTDPSDLLQTYFSFDFKTGQ